MKKRILIIVSVMVIVFASLIIHHVFFLFGSIHYPGASVQTYVETPDNNTYLVDYKLSYPEKVITDLFYRGEELYAGKKGKGIFEGFRFYKVRGNKDPFILIVVSNDNKMMKCHASDETMLKILSEKYK